MFFDDYNKLENTTTRRLIEEDVINPLNDDSFLLDKNTEIKVFTLLKLHQKKQAQFVMTEQSLQKVKNVLRFLVVKWDNIVVKTEAVLII